MDFVLFVILIFFVYDYNSKTKKCKKKKKKYACFHLNQIVLLLQHVLLVAYYSLLVLCQALTLDFM